MAEADAEGARVPKKGGGYKMNTDTVLFLEEVLKYLITMGCIVYNDYERAKESLPSFDKHRRGRNPFGYLAEVLQVTRQACGPSLCTGSRRSCTPSRACSSGRR